MFSIFNLVKDSQMDPNDSMLKLIDKFYPIIKKYSNKLNYDCSESDLIIFFITLIKNIDLSNFPNDAYLISYIKISFENKYKQLLHQNIINQIQTSNIEMDFIDTDDNYSLVISNLFLNELINKSNLTSKQKHVLTQSYLHNESDSKIANSLGVSRQAINRLKKSGINSLKNIIT